MFTFLFTDATVDLNSATVENTAVSESKVSKATDGFLRATVEEKLMFSFVVCTFAVVLIQSVLSFVQFIKRCKSQETPSAVSFELSEL